MKEVTCRKLSVLRKITNDDEYWSAMDRMMSLSSHLVFHHNTSNPEPVFIRDHSLFFAHGKNDSISCAVL
jgi:hypothetical protein